MGSSPKRVTTKNEEPKFLVLCISTGEPKPRLPNYQIITMSNTKKRIAYIDALRGLTMTLVVYQHINTFTGGDSVYGSLWSEALTAFRMPLFFFISGFIAYKAIEWTPRIFIELLFKKAKIQLIPAIVFSLIYTTVFHNNTQIDITRYWFTEVLFEFFAIFYTISLISKQRVWLKNTLLTGFAAAGVICILLHIGQEMTFYDSLCLENALKFFQFFVLGILARQFEQTTKSILNNSFVNSAVIVLFVISLLSLRTTFILESSIFRGLIRSIILRYTGLFIILSLFYRNQEYFAANGIVSRTMQYIGRHTLDIYLIHYFFIEHNGTIAARIHSIGNLPLEIFAIGALALMNIALCLLLSQCIRNSKFLAKYLFGAK